MHYCLKMTHKNEDYENTLLIKRKFNNIPRLIVSDSLNTQLRIIKENYHHLFFVKNVCLTMSLKK